MSINLRFQQIIDNLYAGNKRAFAIAMGVSATVVENVVGKRQGNPSFDVTKKLLLAIDTINPEWLLTGKGEMIKNAYIRDEDAINMASEDTPIYRAKGIQSIPLYNIDAISNLSELFDPYQHTKYNIGDLSIPNAPRCDGAIYVRGDGMYPIVNAGDIICFKAIHDVNNIFWGEMYLIEAAINGEQLLTVKYIFQSETDTDHILLVSENAKHQPIDVLKTNVKGLALVKASVRYTSMR